MARSWTTPAFAFPGRRDRLFRFPRTGGDRALLRALRASFVPLSALSHALSAWWAELIFRTPPRHPRLPSERRALDRGEFRWLPFRDGRLATWSFGNGPPVLLVHGWGGHAGRLFRFFEPLSAAGFSVLAFDAPGHADSSGALSSLPDFVAAVQAVEAEHGPLAGIVGHSVGASAAALAIRRGLSVPRAVLLSTPANPEYYAARFAKYLRMPAPVREGMKRRLASRYAVGWEDLRPIGPGESRAEILVFHDRGDCRVPWKEGAAVAAAWPGARLVTTCGLGHHKILRDPGLVSEAVRFLSEAPASAVRYGSCHS
jgi:pimeloyl-ACP methyl ester carboxylesterase